MIELTNEELDKWKDSFAKNGIVYNTDEEYCEAVNNLVGYFDVLIQMDSEQQAKREEG